MARAHYETYLLDTEGRPIPGATVTVRQPDTTISIAETVYAEDDTDGDTIAGNPFTADADGRIEIWLAVPKVVDLLVTKTGYDPRTVRATVHQLTASALSVIVGGITMSQRAGLHLINGFTAVDDSVNNETEVTPDWAELADMPSTEFGQASSTGVLNEFARGDHEHAMPADPVTAHLGAFAHGDIASATAHIIDTSAAHAASSISYAGGTGMSATDVEAAIDELATEKSDTSHTHLASMPAGALAPYAGAAAPSGWLLADGTAVSRTTFSGLFTAIGTAYGAGDGSTTFNVPDLRQRFPMGKAVSGTGSTLGGTGGNIDHTHSTPGGTSGNESAHTHGVGTLDVAGPSGTRSDISAGGATQISDTFHDHALSGASAAGSAHNHSTPAGTSGTANAPFQTFNFIIKT